MNLDEPSIRDTCTDAVFERARAYRDRDRIQRLERFEDALTAEVQGSELYDVTVELAGDQVETQCTCPYAGRGKCKHVVAVLLDVVHDPPEDESERVDAVLEDISSEDLCAFVRDALVEDSRLRERFLVQFGEWRESVEDYRDEIESLFEKHAHDYPGVTSAIDFSHFFDLAERHRDRERYLAAATVYRALFETIDENVGRVDGAYDHYAEALRSALDGYVECVLAADISDEDCERYVAVLEKRIVEHGGNREAFERALDELDDRCGRTQDSQ
ncbi:SWIM zinc finger domain-containing protein [Haloplanus sp. GCM10025708]|uniref:SWIM zinc finger family protein n=1 Tax=Haloferacaceae TaxID=1644056 RepID=UPI00362392F5